ncbi:glycosyltransferase family A protein [Thiocapsa bogorovii]|uniref:glycosyltransferase family A protein n=1 Tax=Thiocapsa bogorovii TaxID=521689 RepID=UPI001E290E78|nr:glycosyltransferase family A protein [Thiocapsa bogorovii]UHD14920.1 glycosyltransferase family 2 protein [Thiocapsa bogorovii]
MSCRATVIVPTSIDRGPLLRYSVGSVLRQTVTDLEVFIVCDGAEDDTRAASEALAHQDSRVRVFDFPKGTRRGETNRHKILTNHADGEIVCYLCDRDLMLPHHVDQMHRALTRHDFANCGYLDVKEDGRVVPEFKLDSGNSAQRARLVRNGRMGVMLSTMAHRLDFYRKLPFGWRTTPDDWFTDHYMQHQMLSQPGCRGVGLATPSIVYFKRGHHPGWPTQQRAEELKVWSALINDPPALAEKLYGALGEVLTDRLTLQERLKRALLVGGHPPAIAFRRWLRRRLRR